MGWGGGGALLTSVMISKLSHFLLLLLFLFSCLPSPLCPLNNPQISSQNRHHSVGMEPRHANMSPPTPRPLPKSIPGSAGEGGKIQSRRGDDKCALRSDAKCAAKMPGRIRRGRNRDTTTIQTALICHTRKQALSVFHRIKTTRLHLDSAPRSRFISGSISFPLPVLKHSSTTSPSLHQSNNKSTLTARLYPRSPVGGMDSFCSIYIYADALFRHGKQGTSLPKYTVRDVSMRDRSHLEPLQSYHTAASNPYIA